MGKNLFLFLLPLICLCSTGWSDITGFYQNINKETNRPNSVIAIYPYQGKYYGRIIATYNAQGVMEDTMYHPIDRATGVVGNPFYCGLDIVWTSTSDSRGYYIGNVIDPRDGKIYNAKLWKEKGNLILRGEVFVFGKNVVWPPFPEENFTAKFKKPDLTKFVPVIPNK